MIRVEDAGIKLLGASLGIVPCRARFVGRFVAFSTFVSTTSGLFFGQAGAFLGAGPLVPYLEARQARPGGHRGAVRT